MVSASLRIAGRLAQGSVLDNIWADGRSEDSRKRVGRAAGLAIRRSDGDGGPSRHLVILLMLPKALDVAVVVS